MRLLLSIIFTYYPIDCTCTCGGDAYGPRADRKRKAYRPRVKMTCPEYISIIYCCRSSAVRVHDFRTYKIRINTRSMILYFINAYCAASTYGWYHDTSVYLNHLSPAVFSFWRTRIYVNRGSLNSGPRGCVSTSPHTRRKKPIIFFVRKFILIYYHFFFNVSCVY
jgi:hypothetical protein